MKNKKIVNLADGIVNNDAVNKEQLNALELYIININNLLTTTINNINQLLKTTNDKITNMGYYYFTDQLKHNNTNTVKFPSGIDSHPFRSGSDDFKFRIFLDGHYQIIYTDFYRNSGRFKIFDNTNGTDLFIINVDNQSNWTPITINTIDNEFPSNLHF